MAKRGRQKRSARGTANASEKTVPEPLLVGVKDVCSLLGLSRSALYDGLACGRIPSGVKIGRRTLWSLEEMREWVRVGCPSVALWAEYKERVADGTRTS